MTRSSPCCYTKITHIVYYTQTNAPSVMCYSFHRVYSTPFHCNPVLTLVSKQSGRKPFAFFVHAQHKTVISMTGTSEGGGETLCRL